MTMEKRKEFRSATLKNLIVIPGKLAIASATRNPGVSRALDAGFHRHDGIT
jgi:hypothetical protein